MKIETCVKESFTVIGKLGSTSDGSRFVQRLWMQTNANFHEIQHLIKKDEQGNICGFWGAMSDLSGAFQPWEDDFSKGLYLAGAECEDDVIAPKGWTKWVVPGYEYLYVESVGNDTFVKMIDYMKKN